MRREFKKDARRNSFKMRVVSPSETVWSSSYELFCVGSKKYLTWREIFDLFCMFHGTILEGFEVGFGVISSEMSDF